MLRLYPSVVVGLDDRAFEIATAWHSRLDKNAQILVRCMRDIEGVREAVSTFRDLDFHATLRQIGVDPPAGARVRIVSVAYAMGPRAFSGWSGWEEQLAALGHEVQALDHVRLLLARPDAHPDGERQVQPLDGDAPWLLSTRLNDDLRISDERLQELFALLMRMLLFAERRATQHPTVHQGQHAPGHVRLLGFLPENPEVLSPHIEQFVSGVVFSMACEGHRGAADAARERELLACMRQFSRGEADAAAVLKRFLGRSGLASWNLGELILGAESLISRALNIVDPRSVKVAATEPTALPPLTFWQRVAAFFAHLVGLKTDRDGLVHKTREIPRPPGQEDQAFMVSRLTAAKALFAELKVMVHSQPGKHRIPGALVSAWRERLEELVQESLLRAAGEAAGEPASSRECLERWGSSIRADLLGHLKEMLNDWQLPLPEEVEKLKRQMDLSTSVRFTGSLRGGGRVHLEACACSRPLPTEQQNLQVLKLWRGGDFVFVGSSTAVQVTHLNW